MRSKLSVKAITRPNCQCRRTTQRIRMAGMNAGESSKMVGIHRVGQSLCLEPPGIADGDPAGPAMDFLALPTEKKIRSLRCGCGPHRSSSRHTNTHPQAGLQTKISCTCSLGNEGGLDLTGNVPPMQDETVLVL
jgi:hypothetical protein